MTSKFVTFSFESKTGFIGYGNIDVLSTKIRNIHDIKELQNDIATEYDYKKVIVMNWRNYDS